MKKTLLFLSIVLVIFISGCGESMFAAGGNDQSPEAINSVITKAFMDKDYDKILSLYSKNYDTFSNEDAYNYVAALLGKGGFDILNGIDFFIGSNKGNTDDMYSMFYTLIGINSTTTNSQNIINNTKVFFDEAAIVCNTVSCARLGGQITTNDGTTSCSVNTANSTINSLDNNTAFVCSLSGGFGTVTNISNTVKILAEKNNIDTSNINIISEGGLANVISSIQNQSSYDSAINALTNNELKDLANNLNNLGTNISSLEKIVGNLSDADQIFQIFGPDGNYTTQTVKNGLKDYLLSLSVTQEY